MAVDIAELAEKEGTRKVFLGHTDRDVYLAFGRHWGPGIVEVPNSIADSLVESVRRVSRGRKEEDRVNPEGPAPVRSVQLDRASDEELLELVRQRGLNLPGAPVGPGGESTPGLTGDGTDPNALSDLQKAAQLADEASAKLAAQTPPPPPPPAILAPTKPVDGA